MLPDGKNGFSDSTDQQLNAASALSEMVPISLGLWSLDHSFCLLNQSAKSLTHFSDKDFVTRPSLWLERIHPGDRQEFCRFMEKLGKSKSPVRCDYRFFPKGANEPIWLREQSLVRQDQNANGWAIISTYTDISDLKSPHEADTKKDHTGTAKALIHEFQNCIHKMSMELELTQMDLKRKGKSEEVQKVMEFMSGWLSDLREQVFKILEGRTSQDPLTILDSVVRKMRKELTARRVKLRLVRHEPLPRVEGDRDQLCNAFEQLIEFCGSTLNEGGGLEVEARQKEIKGQVYAEVKVTSSSSSFTDPADKQAIIQPERPHIGMGVALATEILRRYQGQVSVQKGSGDRDQVTVLIKSSPT